MIYGMALLAQTSSLRSFRDCQIPLIPGLIMFAVLVVITFAGDRIAKTWKEKVGVKARRCLLVTAVVVIVVIAVVVGRSLTLSRPDPPKLSEARPVDVVSEVSRPEGVPLEGLRR